MGHRMIMVSHLPSVVLMAKLANVDAYLALRTKHAYEARETCVETEEDIGNSILAQKTYNSISHVLTRIYQAQNIDICWIWNGTNSLGRAGKSFCEKHSIDSLYFEIANISNKIFVDKQGVNAESTLFDNVHQLDNASFDYNQYVNWKSNYLKCKMKHHAVNQSSKNKKIAWIQLIDIISIIFQITPYPKRLKLLDFFKPKGNTLKPNDAPDLSRKYVFFPLQVSNDSQLLINSDVNNIEAINRITNEIPNSYKIYVKIHPAESNLHFLKRIAELNTIQNLEFVNGNTFELIQNSVKTYTINSTAGLEAQLLEKPVQYLGKSFFSKLNDKRMGSYIMKFLVNIDYFDQAAITPKQYKTLVLRTTSKNVTLR